MPLAKKGIHHSPEFYELNTLGFASFDAITTTAATTNTTSVNQLSFPCNVKIPKISVSYFAIDSVAGTDSFNIVVGAGAYTQGNTATNDNSYTASNVVPGANTGNLGYPTNFATTGNALFTADIPFSSNATYAYVTPSATATPAAAGGPGYGVSGTGWQVITTTGGYGIFVPSYYDAIYPAGVPITLRVTTPTSPYVTNFRVTLLIEPCLLRVPGPVSGPNVVYSGVPGQDL